MTLPDNLAIPKGSTVLVTGASGMVGSNIADRFLHYGFKVRGTTRDPEKHTWLSDLFAHRYGKGAFEFVAVPDMTAGDAYTAGAQGCTAVVHTAAVMAFDPDPNKTIPAVIAGAVNALRAAYAEPSVRRFVLLSSIAAAILPSVDTEVRVVSQDTWSEPAVAMAWAPPPYEPERAGINYAAGKVQSEQEVWRYHRENRHRRPDLVVNTVLPNMVFGKTLDAVNQGSASTLSHTAALWNNTPEELTQNPYVTAPQFYINNQDTGRLHVAAAILPDVAEERIFGTAGPYNLDAILEILRRHYPDREFPPDFASGENPNIVTEAQKRGEEILRALGEPGWVSLEETVLANVEDLQ